MALVLTRGRNRALYLGEELDPRNMEETFDHKVTVLDLGEPDAGSPLWVRLAVSTRIGDDLVSNEVDLDDEKLWVDLVSEKDTPTRISLVKVENMLGKNQELAVCARLAFEAPRSVRIIRDNAVKWD